MRVAKIWLRPAARPITSPAVTPISEPTPSTTKLSLIAFVRVPSAIISKNAPMIAVGGDSSTGLIALPYSSHATAIASTDASRSDHLVAGDRPERGGLRGRPDEPLPVASVFSVVVVMRSPACGR